MNSIIIRSTLVAIATLMATTPSVQAQQGNSRQSSCSQQHDRNCDTRSDGRNDGRGEDNSKRNDNTHQRNQQQAKSNGPKVGGNGQRGRPFQQAHNSRFPKPPQGQEYRVIDNNIVRVDKNTLKIVAVLGLLDALTR
jgi:Ni/Co efflux regulator RcnB